MNAAPNLIFNPVKAGLTHVNKDEVTHKISEISKGTKMNARAIEKILPIFSKSQY